MSLQNRYMQLFSFVLIDRDQGASQIPFPFISGNVLHSLIQKSLREKPAWKGSLTNHTLIHSYSGQMHSVYFNLMYL